MNLNENPIYFSSIWILIVAVLLFAYTKVRSSYKRQRKKMLREREARWNQIGKSDTQDRV